jgi:hypothetical protein
LRRIHRRKRDEKNGIEMAFALDAERGLAYTFVLALDQNDASSRAIGTSCQFLEEHGGDLVGGLLH